MPSPKGVVVAVNGPWGSGKSSAVNLVVFHLDELIKQEKLKLIRFSPWWLSGIEAITAAFFAELEAAIGRSAGKQALDAIQKFTRRVLHFGKAAGTAADLYIRRAQAPSSVALRTLSSSYSPMKGYRSATRGGCRAPGKSGSPLPSGYRRHRPALA
jgi:predicted KAP-like P-loop ATPase